MTTKPHKAPKGKATASAIQKPIAPAVPPLPPPEGWKQQTAFGFMRSDDTSAGRLVRLADVLRWLESSKELPRTAALDLLCDDMPADVLQWCYQLHQTERARPLPSECMFGYRTHAQIEDERKGREIDARNRAMRTDSLSSWGRSDGGLPPFRAAWVHSLVALPEPTIPGRPALLRLIRAWWSRMKLRRDSTCDVLDDPKAFRPNSLAIRLDKAAELWGYGRAVQSSATDVQPTTWPELVAYRKRHPGGRWTPEMRTVLAAEKVARAGQSAIAKALSAALDVSVQVINAQLLLHRQSQTTNSGTRVHRLA